MHGHSETLVDLECRLGERMVIFAVLNTARANGLSAVARVHIDRECKKILRDVDALHEHIAAAQRASAGLSVQDAVARAPK